MMNAIELDHAVKLIFNLSNGGHAVSRGSDDECALDTASQTQTQSTPAPAETENNPKTGQRSFIIPAIISVAAVFICRKRKN
jgi:hypothetical protein